MSNSKLVLLAAFTLCQFRVFCEDIDQSQETICGSTPHPYRVEMRHIESKGIGYNQGYTTIEGFFTVPHTLKTSWVPFLDLRAHIFNNGEPAATAGAGLRYVNTRTWGFNTYYDYRKTNRYHYNQVGLGLETLGETWDYRINGYLPVGKKKSPFYHTKFDKFEGHFMKLVRKQEFAMKGVNAEVGAHFFERKNIDFYAAAGPYYLENEGKVAWGGEGRFVINALDYLRVQLSGSYDSIYHGIVQGELSLVVPFGGRKKIKQKQNRTCSSQTTMSHRALQRVDRFEIMPVDRKKHHTTAINPATGDPYFFVFVDNTSHSLGTFESPYNALTDAQTNSKPNDIIYVFPGNAVYELFTPMTLQTGQQLLGAGTDYLFRTQWGKVNVQHQATGLPVLISNQTMANAVVLNLENSNNVVSGLNFVMTHPFAVGGSGNHGAIAILGGENYLISRNILIAAGAGGTVGLSINTPSSVTISNNIFASSLSTDQIGIYVNTSGGSLVINDNLFTGINGNTGLANGINIHSSTASDLSVSILSNVFNSQSNTDASGSIVIIIESSDNVFATITGNQMTLPPGLINQVAGVHLIIDAATTGVLSATLNNNTAITTTAPGYFFDNNGTPTQLQVDFQANNIGTVSGLP